MGGEILTHLVWEVGVLAARARRGHQRPNFGGGCVCVYCDGGCITRSRMMGPGTHCSPRHSSDAFKKRGFKKRIEKRNVAGKRARQMLLAPSRDAMELSNRGVKMRVGDVASTSNICQPPPQTQRPGLPALPGCPECGGPWWVVRRSAGAASSRTAWTSSPRARAVYGQGRVWAGPCSCPRWRTLAHVTMTCGKTRGCGSVRFADKKMVGGSRRREVSWKRKTLRRTLPERRSICSVRGVAWQRVKCHTPRSLRRK